MVFHSFFKSRADTHHFDNKRTNERKIKQQKQQQTNEWFGEWKEKKNYSWDIYYCRAPNRYQFSIVCFKNIIKMLKSFTFICMLKDTNQKEETVEIKKVRFRTIAMQHKSRRWLKNSNTLKFSIAICCSPICTFVSAMANFHVETWVLFSYTYRLNGIKGTTCTSNQLQEQQHTVTPISTVQQNKRRKEKENQIERKK